MFEKQFTHNELDDTTKLNVGIRKTAISAVGHYGPLREEKRFDLIKPEQRASYLEYWWAL